MLQNFIPKETKRIIYEACDRYAKNKNLNFGSVQLSLGLKMKEGSEDEVDVTYSICENYRIKEHFTFLEVLGVRWDFKGYGNFAPAVIQNGLIRYAMELDIEPLDVKAVCLPFDEEVENKRGKLVINQDIKIFIYNKSQYLKQVSVKEFINLEMDLAE